MPWRLRKSKKIAPGVRLNIGKRGTSLSFGRRGATINVGHKGIRSTLGIPGTGISYTSKTGSGCLLLLLLPIFILLTGLACSGSSSITPTPGLKQLTTPTVETRFSGETSQDEVIYLLSVAENIEAIGSSLKTLGKLFQNPRLDDQEWIINVAVEITSMRTAHENLTQLVPPSGMAHIHKAILDATGDCAASTDYLTTGIDHRDVEALNKAKELITSCGSKIVTASKLIERRPGDPRKLRSTVNQNANLRAGPGTDYPKIGSAAAGTTLTIIGRNEAGDWLMIERPDGSRAWIAAFLVDNAPNLDSLPIMPAPLPPTSQQDVSAESASSTSPWTNPNAFICIGGCAEPPDPSCAIKGNVNPSTGTKIYHTPASRWYERTDVKPEEGDRWFCTEAEAKAAGFRPPER